MMLHKIANDKAERYEVLDKVISNKCLFHIGAEIGVRHGETAEYLLKQNPGLRLILVDPYLPYIDLEHTYTQAEQDGIKIGALTRLQPFADKVTWRYLPSLEAAKLAFPGSLDFVFIDAKHTYAAALSDIMGWHEKVRKGGVLCGHDYYMDDVRKAVDLYASTYGRDVHHVDNPADLWYIFID